MARTSLRLWVVIGRAHTAGILGVEGYTIEVQAEVGLGLPCLVLVGQVSGALAEARERVRSALSYAGVELGSRKQIVNLAPSDERKHSPGADLAIAVALLVAHGQIPQARVDGLMLWGELELDGSVRGARGSLIVAEHAKRAGARALAVGREHARQAALIAGIEVYAIEHLAQLVAWLRGERTLDPEPEPAPAALAAAVSDVELDLADVRGLSLARLAIEVMVAGGHNVLLEGPPGVGKTMLARRVPELMPPLALDEAIEVTKIHAIAGLGRFDRLCLRPPLRAPHHTVSVAGLLGGGTPPRPGEVSLAHRGVLFLDELPEFSRACLEGLREPVEDGAVTIVRAAHALTMPAQCQILAAMNPCPCGYLGHPERTCSDPAAAVARYRARVSGPFLDRIDLVVPIVPRARAALSELPPGESTAVVRARIEQARARQRRRLARHGISLNARIPAQRAALAEGCPLEGPAARLLAAVAARHGLSPRAQLRLRRVAQTLADLADRPRITDEDVAAAASLRATTELAGAPSLAG